MGFCKKSIEIWFCIYSIYTTQGCTPRGLGRRVSVYALQLAFRGHHRVQERQLPVPGAPPARPQRSLDGHEGEGKSRNCWTDRVWEKFALPRSIQVTT